MKVTKEQLQKLFEEDLQGQFPMELYVSSKILDFVSSERKENLERISFGKLLEVTNVEMQMLASAAQYLTGDRAQLLELKFVFIDNDTPIEISDETARILDKTGQFNHPLTGEKVINGRSKVFLMFGLGKNGLDIVTGE